jgi:hypothetical protein
VTAPAGGYARPTPRAAGARGEVTKVEKTLLGGDKITVQFTNGYTDDVRPGDIERRTTHPHPHTSRTVYTGQSASPEGMPALIPGHRSISRPPVSRTGSR